MVSGLMHLPLDILRTIVEDLFENHRDAVLVFRLVSKACLHESEYHLYRSTTLHDGTALAKSMTSHLVSRLTHNTDHLAGLVRHLTVGNFADEGFFYFELTPSLDKILQAAKDLLSLTWVCSRSIRPATLDLFHKLHPSAKLHLRARPRSLTPLYHPLLSSAQLHSLDITLHYRKETIHRTELDTVRDYIIGSNLRVLHLDLERLPASHVQFEAFLRWETVNTGQLNLNLRPEVRFPALEELKISSGRYDFSEAHCNAWAQAMVHTGAT